MALATLTSSIISVILSTISILLVLFQQRGKIAVSCSETQFKNSYSFQISVTNVGRQPGKQIRYSYVLVEKIPITRVVIHTDRVIHYLSHIQSIVVVFDNKEDKN